MIADKLVDRLDFISMKTRDIGQATNDYSLVDDGLDTGNFRGNRKLSLLIEKNDLVKGRLFVAFD